MQRARIERSPLPAHARKVRTSDCDKCLLMNSLTEAGVPESTSRALCERMWLNRIRKGQTLYSEGNRSTHLYAIRSGRVKLLRTDVDGCEHVMGLLESGDLFGFEAIFDTSYLNEARALTHTELCIASGNELRALMSEIPRLSIDLAKYLHHQLCRTRDRQLCLGASGASAKIASYILQSISTNGGSGEEETPIVAPDLTQRDLGGLLGISPETVCRTLGDFKARGILESSPAGIRVRDIRSLRRLARY